MKICFSVRVYREAGLCLKRKKRRRGVRIGAPRPALTGANREWALDSILTKPVDPLAFGASVFALLLASAIAGYLPARRASRIEPIDALWPLDFHGPHLGERALFYAEPAKFSGH